MVEFRRVVPADRRRAFVGRDVVPTIGPKLLEHRAFGRDLSRKYSRQSATGRSHSFDSERCNGLYTRGPVRRYPTCHEADEQNRCRRSEQHTNILWVDTE